MIRALLLPVLSILLPRPAAADPGDDWRVLFDGSNLDGWSHVGEGGFEEADGSIKTVGNMGLLWYTKEKFGDCVIRVVYKAESGDDNSGVYIRIADEPADPWFAVHHGYEVQICDSADPFHRTGAIYSLSESTASPAKPGEWNTLEITLDGEIVAVSVNGEPVNRFDPSQPVPPRRRDYEPERGPRPTHGYIGLQNHNPEDVVYFKEVSVRPLEKAEEN